MNSSCVLPVEIWALIASYHAPTMGRLMLVVKGLAEYLKPFMDPESDLMRGFVRTVYTWKHKVIAESRIEGSPGKTWLRHGKGMCSCENGCTWDRGYLTHGYCADKHGVYVGDEYYLVGEQYESDGCINIVRKSDNFQNPPVYVESFEPHMRAEHRLPECWVSAQRDILVEYDTGHWYRIGSQLSFGYRHPLFEISCKRECKLRLTLGQRCYITSIITKSISGHVTYENKRFRIRNASQYLSYRPGHIFYKDNDDTIHIRILPNREVIVYHHDFFTCAHAHYRDGYIEFFEYVNGRVFKEPDDIINHKRHGNTYRRIDGRYIRKVKAPDYRLEIIRDGVQYFDMLTINERIRGFYPPGNCGFIDGRLATTRLRSD